MATCHVCPPDDQHVPDPVELPWSYWDGVVETELRVDHYPYGGGVAGSGVQITLDQHRDGRIIAVRLPEDSARRLAQAILGTLDQHVPDHDMEAL